MQVLYRTASVFIKHVSGAPKQAGVVASMNRIETLLAPDMPSAKCVPNVELDWWLRPAVPSFVTPVAVETVTGADDSDDQATSLPDALKKTSNSDEAAMSAVEGSRNERWCAKLLSEASSEDLTVGSLNSNGFCVLLTLLFLLHSIL